MAVQSILETMEGMVYLSVLRCYFVETVLCPLLLEVLEGMLCVLGLVEGVRRTLKGLEIVHCRHCK